jgi:hypothetical protein
MFNFGFGVPTSPPASAPAFGVNGFQISATNFQWTHAPVANPTTRPDGSALITGDRIQDSTTGDMWRWNGTLWLSHDFQAQSWINGFANGTGLNVPFDTPVGRDVFIREVVYSCNPQGGSTTSGTNTLTTTIRVMGAANTLVFSQNLPNGTVVPNGIWCSIKQSVGVTAPVKALGAAFSGLHLNVGNSLGYSLFALNWGLRWALVR